MQDQCGGGLEEPREDRRLAANRARTVRHRAARKVRAAHATAAAETALARLSPTDRCAAIREQSLHRIAAHLARQAFVSEALRTGLRVAIECSMGREHSPPELRSLAKQLQLAAAANRRAAQPVALALTGFCGSVRDAANAMGAQSWPVVRHEGSIHEVFSPEQVESCSR